MKKEYWLGVAFVLLIFLISLSFVSAITASIGNARMVVRSAPGETVEKYVLVKNVNDVSVSINLTASGDLEENIKLKEESFILNPGEEKKAYFTIKADKEGTFESQISVAFSSLSEEGKKTGVGLHSTIILITSGDVVEDTTEKGEEDESGIIDSLKNKVSKLTGESKEKKTSSGIILLLFSTTILVVLLGFLVFLIKRKQNQQVSPINSRNLRQRGIKQGRKK